MHKRQPFSVESDRVVVIEWLADVPDPSEPSKPAISLTYSRASTPLRWPPRRAGEAPDPGVECDQPQEVGGPEPGQQVVEHPATIAPRKRKLVAGGGRPAVPFRCDRIGIDAAKLNLIAPLYRFEGIARNTQTAACAPWVRQAGRTATGRWAAS